MADHPEPHVYGDLNEVPAPWQTLQGGRLSLDQVNALLRDAYANGRTNEHGHFIPDLGGARQRFMAAHGLVDGWWAAAEGRA
jgi:hypothetical protein